MMTYLEEKRGAQREAYYEARVEAAQSLQKIKGFHRKATDLQVEHALLSAKKTAMWWQDQKTHPSMDNDDLETIELEWGLAVACIADEFDRLLNKARPCGGLREGETEIVDRFHLYFVGHRKEFGDFASNVKTLRLSDGHKHDLPRANDARYDLLATTCVILQEEGLL